MTFFDNIDHKNSKKIMKIKIPDSCVYPCSLMGAPEIYSKEWSQIKFIGLSLNKGPQKCLAKRDSE